MLHSKFKAHLGYMKPCLLLIEQQTNLFHRALTPAGACPYIQTFPSPCPLVPCWGLSQCPGSHTQRILEDKDYSLPATMVQPRTGALCWFLDEAAARLLSVPFEKHSTL